MKPPAFASLRVCIRLLALIVMMALAPVHADEYDEVGKLISAGRIPDARARVERALAAKPRDPQMRYLKGLIQRESGQRTEALLTFTQLTEDYPELPEPYNGLAAIHAANGDYDKARDALELALRANPGYAIAQENLGDVYVRLAARAYCKALQADAKSSAAAPKLAKINQTCP